MSEPVVFVDPVAVSAKAPFGANPRGQRSFSFTSYSGPTMYPSRERFDDQPFITGFSYGIRVCLTRAKE